MDTSTSRRSLGASMGAHPFASTGHPSFGASVEFDEGRRASTMRSRAKSLAMSDRKSSPLHESAVKPESLRSSMALSTVASRRLVNLMSEETKAALRKSFVARQVDGTVTVEQFFDILAEIEEVVDASGVVYNSGLVHKMYAHDGDDVAELLSLKEVYSAIGRFIAKGQAHDARLADETAKRDQLSSERQEVRYVSFKQYVKKHMTCKPKRKGEPEYFWRRIPPIQRKVATMLLMLLSFIFVAVATVLVLGLQVSHDVHVEARRDTTAMARFLSAVTVGMEANNAAASEEAANALAGKLEPSLVAVMSAASAERRAIRGVTSESQSATVARRLQSELDDAVARVGVAPRIIADLVRSQVSASFTERDVAAVLAAIADNSTGTASFAVTFAPSLAVGSSGGRSVPYRSSLFTDDAAVLRFVDENAVDLGFANMTTRTYTAMRAPTFTSPAPVDGAAIGACATYPEGEFVAVGRVTVCVMELKRFVAARAVSALTQLDAGMSDDGTTCRVLLASVSATSAPGVSGNWSLANSSIAVSPPPSASHNGVPLEWLAVLPTPASVRAIGAFPAAAKTVGERNSATTPAILLDFAVTTTWDAAFELATAYVCEGSRSGVDARALSTLSVRLRNGTNAATIGRRTGALPTAVSVTRNEQLLAFDAHTDHPPAVLAAYGASGVGRALTQHGKEVLATYAALESAGVNLLVETFDEPRTNEQVAGPVVALRDTLESYEDVFMLADFPSTGLAYTARPALCGASSAPCGIPAPARHAFLRRRLVEDSAVMEDGARYLITAMYVPEAHAVVGVLLDAKHLINHSWIWIGGMVAIAVVVAAIAAVAVYFTTARVLRRIELEYQAYKSQIENEKVQFSELVKDVMPSFISSRIITGEKLIVDNHPMLTFLFSDIVNCGDLVRHMSTVEMVRLLGYTFMLQDYVAEHYNIHKLKTIGDAFFCVAGLEDLVQKRKEAEQRKKSLAAAEAGETKGGKGDQSPEAENLDASVRDQGGKKSKDATDEKKIDNQVLRMVSFAVVVQQLLGGDFVHYPERTDCFLESAGEDLGRMEMVSMQIGIHCGPAIAGVVDVGRAPHFDCFGPSVNLASRMETTAPIDRLQISAPTYELLRNVDKKDEFDWDPPKKTLIKGYGTFNTYIIKSTTLQVPEAILSRLHVDRAVRLRYFNESGLVISADRNMSDYDDQSVMLRQSESSAHLSVASSPKHATTPDTK